MNKIYTYIIMKFSIELNQQIPTSGYIGFDEFWLASLKLDTIFDLQTSLWFAFSMTVNNLT